MSTNLEEAYKKCNKLMDELHVVTAKFNSLYEDYKDVQLIGKHIKIMNSNVEKCYTDCLNEMAKYYTDYFASLRGKCVKKPTSRKPATRRLVRK